MSQTEDKRKRTLEEQRALEQYVREHPESTLLKEERTAKYIECQRLKNRRETPVTHAEIDRLAKREREYGSAEWTLPELEGVKLGNPLLLPKRPSAALWNALERFVQLPDGTLEDLRNRYSAFLPPWFYSLPCDNDAVRNLSAGGLAWQVWHTLLREAWRSGFHPEYVAQLVNIPTVPPGNTRFEVQPVSDAQRAVLAMALETWRARYCPKCGRPFVARKAADKYCSDKCFSESRREKQLASKRYRRKHSKRKPTRRGGK